MKRHLPILLAIAFSLPLGAQRYDITFRIDGATDSMMYIGRHFRDKIHLLDSTRRAANGVYSFQGKKRWPQGIYALVGQGREKAIGNFTIDGSQRFTIEADDKLTPSTVKVKGCPANQQMFSYLDTVAKAKQQMDDIRQRQKDPSTKPQADADEKALVRRMDAFEKQTLLGPKPIFFFQAITLCREPEVPDSVENKAYYFRSHYWDNITPSAFQRLKYTPNLYNKLNLFFYNILYRADSDTINTYIDRLAAHIGDDTAMLRYVFDHIEPRYFRSTRNIGWDAVWCHLAGEYYLKGRCPWVTEGTLHNMRYNFNRISQSIIGMHGQELWMADTNQSPDPKDWISSHRFPSRYVILWFWDPDCHHCQEQSAELKTLYDSLPTFPARRFEVYAIGYESDVEKWKRYVREHDFRWTNVGGTHVNIDYQEAYNVHSAPTMIILNEKRDIIMNKTLPVKSLLKFLDDYERHHPSEN